MSSFLSAAEIVARQRQNVRCDLKKRLRKKSERLSWHRRVIICLFSFCAVQETCLNYSKTIIFIFWYHCDTITIRIKRVFPCINVCQVPRELLKTEAEGRGFQRFPRGLANVNALENNV